TTANACQPHVSCTVAQPLYPDRRLGRYPSGATQCRRVEPPVQPTISLPEKNCAISSAAVAGASDPCTEFSPIDFACTLRMVPAAALAGSVAPMMSRYLAMALSPSRTWTTTGPEI